MKILNSLRAASKAIAGTTGNDQFSEIIGNQNKLQQWANTHRIFSLVSEHYRLECQLKSFEILLESDGNMETGILLHLSQLTGLCDVEVYISHNNEWAYDQQKTPIFDIYLFDE